MLGEIAAPAENPVRLPAAEKAIGTVLAMPRPDMAKAMIANQSLGARPPASMPAAAMNADQRMVLTAPKRLRTPSPAKRMIAIEPAKKAKARPDTETVEPSSLDRYSAAQSRTAPSGTIENSAMMPRM